MGMGWESRRAMIFRDDVQIAWGYSYRRVWGMARWTVERYPSALLPIDEAIDEAMGAIVIALLEADEPPAVSELMDVARGALAAACTDLLHYRGYDHRRRDLPAGSMRGFQRYWRSYGQGARSPEEPIIEKLALAQIWPTLSLGEQEALQALGALGDYTPAAAALGITKTAFAQRVAAGRRRFFAAWFEGTDGPVHRWTDRRGPRRGAMGKLRRRRRLA